MTTHREKTRLYVSGSAVQQLSNYVAVSKTKSADECLRELILNTLLTFENESSTDITTVQKLLNDYFGIDCQRHQVESAVNYLLVNQYIMENDDHNLTLRENTREKINDRIQSSINLQNNVKDYWILQLNANGIMLDSNKLWSSLQDYLAKAFLRHGIQVVSFLDSNYIIPDEYKNSLSMLLHESVKPYFNSEDIELACRLISDFLAEAGENKERTNYISECADGATSYYSLVVSPNTAGSLRDKLGALTIFCDTNFLFGILDLHVHPMVDISKDLVKAINDYNLPVTLKYHEATGRELRASIAHYGEVLAHQRWKQAISRAAVRSRGISGIEMKYHQLNGIMPTDVEDFLRPYRTVDTLLRQHSIIIHNPQEDRLAQRANIEVDYKLFLKNINKEKDPDLVQHDCIILDCVRSQRNGDDSSENVRSFLVTCDYMLYKFDVENSKKSDSIPVTVLPNVLWQVLRPFMASSERFNKSFAETFAIPEFRAIGSIGGKACSKMLSILNSLKDMPEETATKVLSDNVLIENLKHCQNDSDFQQAIESAIVTENVVLMEDRARLERANKELKQREEEKAEIIKRQQDAINEKEKALESQIKQAGTTERSLAEKISLIESERDSLSAQKDFISDRAKEDLQTRENQIRKLIKILGIIISCSVTIFFIIFVHYIKPWSWLLKHNHSNFVQGCLSIAIFSFVLGLIVKEWRNFLYGSVLFTIICMLYQYLSTS